MNNKIYPFKFLDSYTAEDKDIFFGREEEVRQLYQMIYQSDTLLLYGASGTGKTSLIQCGLASQFQQHDWLDVFIRRHKNLNESLNKALIAIGGEGASSTDALDDDEDWLNDIMGDHQASSSHQELTPTQVLLKNIYLQHFRPIYLIFDQFEELFILGNKAEQYQFITTIKEILAVEQPVKLIFSIREEYLGSLYEFEKVIPELLRKKLRIDPMNLEKVKAVVLGATRCNRSIVHIEETEAEAIAEQVFEKIRGEDNTLTIQLPYLQVFLDKYYRHISKDRSKNPSTEATLTLAALEEIGDIGNILRDFLEEQILEIAQKQQSDPKTIWKILSPFVTVDGTKEPISLDGLDQQLVGIKRTLIEQVVLALINNRILRYIEEEELYEIAHDSLALRIAEKRSDEEINLLEVRNLIKSQSQLKDETRELFSERQLTFIAPFLEQLQLNEEEELLILESRKQVEEAQRAATRTKIVIGSSLILVFIIIGLFAISSQYQKNIAQTESQKNQKILDAMDFYEDQYALAFKNEKYGFIDKQGNTTVNFEYDKGEPFDPETGFAEMEKSVYRKGNPEQLKYLIDTSGNRYRLIKVVEALQYGGRLNVIFSKANVQWIEAKLPKDNDRERLLAEVEAIHKDVATATSTLLTTLKQEKNKLALDFSGVDKHTTLRVLKTLQEEPAIKSKIELLFLKNTNLDVVPDFLAAFKNLKWLDLSQTIITNLPSFMGQFQQLSRLDLNRTNITTFPEIIGELSSLESLSLIGDIKNIPDNIGQLNQLKKLSIDGIFETLPNNIGQLSNLEKLHLNSYELRTIPTAIGQLTQLKVLSLRGTFEALPSSIAQLKKLTKLKVESSTLSSIPDALTQLTGLKELFLDGVYETIPDNIGQFQQLEELVLVSRALYALPESIGQLSKLKELLLSSLLETLPESIGQLQQLKRLSLNLEELKVLPVTIGNLSNLQTFSIYGSLSTLPTTIGDLNNLIDLSINSSLETLPSSIGKLTKLKMLLLQNTALKQLPESIGNLTNLTELVIEGPIEVLPISFKKLTKIESLYLHTSILKTLPKNIEDLISLKHCSITGMFETFPKSFGTLQQLQTLTLHNQVLKILPDNIGNLTNLNELILGGTFKTLPNTIGQLKKIEKLRVINPELQRIPENLTELSKLNHLILQGNFETLPSNFGKLYELEYLSIRNPVLQTLPDNIGDLHNLKELTLETSIQTLPSSFSRLSDLETLDLNKNPQLTTFPNFDSFRQLVRLNCALYDNQYYASNKRKLSAFSDQSPNCIIYIDDKKTGSFSTLGKD